MIDFLLRRVRALALVGWRQAAIGLAVLLALSVTPLLVGVDGPIWDASSYFAPSWTLVADHARAGKLLLWNPFVEGGSPDGAQPEYGALSPVVLALGLLLGGTLTGFVVYMLALWVLAASGMLMLARHLGAPPWAGFVVACGWATSGTFTGHFQHASWFCSYAAMPWVIWRLDVALAERRLAPALQAGSILGLAGLSGYPAIIIQTGILATLWAIGRALTAAAPGAGRWRALASLGRHALAVAAVGIVAVVVVSPSWLAFLSEAQGYTWRRGGLPRHTVVHDNALHPGALTTAASPYLHVVAALWAPEMWAPTDGSSLGCYSGVAVVGLAVFACARRRHSAWVWWLVGSLVFFLTASTDALPLRGLLHDLLPWERFARHGAQRKDLALFVLAVIALVGVARAGGRGQRGGPLSAGDGRLFSRCAAATAIGAITLAGAAWWFLADPGPRPVFAILHLVLSWGGLVAVAALAASSRRTVRTLATGALVLVALLDAGGTLRLSRVLMVDRGRGREVWERITREGRHELDLTPAGLARQAAAPDWTWPRPNNQNVPLRIAVLESYSVLTNPFRALTVEEPLLARVALGDERVWFAPAARMAVPNQEAWCGLVAASREAGAAVLVVHPPATMVGQDPEALGDKLAEVLVAQGAEERAVLRPVPAEVRRHRTDEVVLSVEAPAAGWVFLSDRWARGWRARFDGIPAPVWGANLLFRAVRVEGGRHTLHFVYRPSGLSWRLALSWSTLLAIGAGALRRRASV